MNKIAEIQNLKNLREISNEKPLTCGFSTKTIQLDCPFTNEHQVMSEIVEILREDKDTLYLTDQDLNKLNFKLEKNTTN